MKAGASRGVGMRAIGSQTTSATAVVVQTGVCRVEIGRALIDEFEAGSAYGLGGLFAAAASSPARCARSGSGVQHRCSELTLRAPASSEGCRCIAISSTALKRALVEFPEDRERLRGLLNMVSQQIDGPRRVLAAVQFSESFMQIAAHSLTRHILMPGEYVFREGQRHPDGIRLPTMRAPRAGGPGRCGPSCQPGAGDRGGTLPRCLPEVGHDGTLRGPVRGADPQPATVPVPGRTVLPSAFSAGAVLCMPASIQFRGWAQRGPQPRPARSCKSS
ncbi:unnamed protein product [Prorocentrum cordatum]|uniref:Cyclic nucleotide-binding domain-containing protein n=1 Tax=Prorocentrum cordatum TaxID=2364126 RepID=A0ABN9TZE1_9DINO|nr:unnamed protein product [Polarella glacialis]